MTDYRKRYEDILATIAESAARSGRKGSEITVMAVTKTRTLDEITEMSRETGLQLFGENRVQEAEPKIGEWPEELPSEWHLVGHLQRNKARKAVDLFSTIQSLDSIRLADTLHRICYENDTVKKVLIEVNTSGEETKYGVLPERTMEIAEHLITHCSTLDLKGLMTVGPLHADERGVRQSFSLLRDLRERISRGLGCSLPVLSMGMTGDFAWAVEEGSTLVRIGTGLLGERKY